VLVEQGRVMALLGDDEPLPANAEPIDMGGASLAPGFIDLHLHGELVFAPADDVPAALARTASALLKQGTTGFLATTVAWNDARIRGFVTQCQAALTQARQGCAELLGVHLEGPWINPAAAGAQPGAAIRPYKPAEDRDIFAMGSGVIKMVTLAPECEGVRTLVDMLARDNVIASLGHSHARHDEIDACVSAGMTHVTHLFNAMGPIHHRDPGVAGWAMGDDRVSCDLICDGVHVHPSMVRTASRAKGDKLLLVTDRVDPPTAQSGEPGHRSFGSGALYDDGSAIRMADGGLAGSNLTLDRAVRNAESFGAMTRLEAIAATTLRPAKLLGLEAERGTLRPGARADFAILSDSGEVRETWLAGERVFEADR
jgi:N-acetylglucosamine-6-phosphate deacetylase